jgi:hypothetical protein
MVLRRAFGGIPEAVDRLQFQTRTLLVGLGVYAQGVYSYQPILSVCL